MLSDKETGAPTKQGLGRPFLIILAGQTVSTVGTMLSGVAVAVYVFLETGSTVWLGVLTAFGSAPYVLAGFLATWVDRFSRRATMIFGDTLAGSTTMVLIVLVAADSFAVWHLAAASVIAGFGTAVQESASSAALPSLVAPDQLDRANGLRQISPALGIVIGPVLATPLLAFGGLEIILLVDAVTFALGILSVVVTPFFDPPRLDELDDDGTLRSAWLWLGESPSQLRRLMAMAASANFIFAAFNIALLALATTVAGTAGAGIVLGVAGLSMLAGSVVASSRSTPDDRLRPMRVALLAAGFGSAVAAARPNAFLLAFGVVLALFWVPAVNASVSTVYNERVPPQMQGRVFALRSALGMALQPLGSLFAGVAIAVVAEPAMDGGFLANTVGVLIGRGQERGAALMLIGIGIALVALAFAVRSLRIPAAGAGPQQRASQLQS